MTVEMLPESKSGDLARTTHQVEIRNGKTGDVQRCPARIDKATDD